jgi:hypothetical protein
VWGVCSRNSPPDSLLNSEATDLRYMIYNQHSLALWLLQRVRLAG